jgi:hypothetical protein
MHTTKAHSGVLESRSRVAHTWSRRCSPVATWRRRSSSVTPVTQPQPANPPPTTNQSHAPWCQSAQPTLPSQRITHEHPNMHTRKCTVKTNLHGTHLAQASLPSRHLVLMQQQHRPCLPATLCQCLSPSFLSLHLCQGAYATVYS